MDERLLTPSRQASLATRQIFGRGQTQYPPIELSGPVPFFLIVQNRLVSPLSDSFLHFLCKGLYSMTLACREQ